LGRGGCLWSGRHLGVVAVVSAEMRERRARPTVWWFAPAGAFGIAIVVGVAFQQTFSRDSFVPAGDLSAGIRWEWTARVA
jgi:hypothetical protein